MGRGEIEEKLTGKMKSRKWGSGCGIGYIFTCNSRNWSEKITLDQQRTH